MAYTNAVPKNGSITQNHSGKNTKKSKVPINETKVIIQYLLLEPVFVLIISNYGANLCFFYVYQIGKGLSFALFSSFWATILVLLGLFIQLFHFSIYFIYQFLL